MTKHGLIALAFVSCSLAPDGVTVGAGHTWNNFDTIGFTPQDKFNTLDGGTTDSVYAELHWAIGPARPLPQESWDKFAGIMDSAAAKFAASIPKPQQTINIGPPMAPTPMIIPPLYSPPVYGPPMPTKEEQEKATTMGILEWYAHLGLIVQITIAIVILGILLTLIMYRKYAVKIISLFKKKKIIIEKEEEERVARKRRKAEAEEDDAS